jgi:hypothetical protein
LRYRATTMADRPYSLNGGLEPCSTSPTSCRSCR